MTPIQKIKPAAIPRAGYDYQDLVGIEVLIRYYRDPDLFEWVVLESDDQEIQSLDDIVALRRDGSVEYVQVKFTADPGRHQLDWEWLLASKPRGTSMLAKWVASFLRARTHGPVHSAALRTNRAASAAFLQCLEGDRVQFDRLDDATRARVIVECGGQSQAELFFREFAFMSGMPDLDRLVVQLREKLVPTDTDLGGWNLLCAHVRRWATYKAEPPPDGRITHEHLVQLITRKRPRPIRQDFHVPEGYVPPSAAFDRALHKRVAGGQAPLTVLWGTPGRGKSTYLSYLADDLASNGLVLRHHYFLSMSESTANRSSFFDVANSLTHQIIAKDPAIAGEMLGRAETLRDDIQLVAERLSARGQRLFLIIDGLDHVWRDTSRMDQLEHLFNVLLPLPQNVSLIVGTQRVSDAQLPTKLLVQASDTDWVEIPPMDRPAVRAWVEAQDAGRPLLLILSRNVDRGDQVRRLAEALWDVSQGHPLHLIYVLESLRRSDAPISVDAVKTIPRCPAGDIRKYYAFLWKTLAPDAKRILHALAGSQFYWPSSGIRRCFGDYGAIEFLLEPRPSGMMPFHGSVFAWVRERPEHAEVFDALLPEIVRWLESAAPEYWRWAWLWIVKARAGQPDDLLSGGTRDWAIASLAAGWSEDQIENILEHAETQAFKHSDLALTVALRSIKTRVSNARDFQSQNYGLFRANAICIAGNIQQARNLIDELPALADENLLLLARLAPEGVRQEVISACLEELAQRVNTWLALRHTPADGFTKLADAFVGCALLVGPSTLPRVVRFLGGFRDPGPRYSRYILALGDAADFDSLEQLRRKLRAQRWEEQHRLIEEQLLRAALRVGRDPATVQERARKTLSPFVAARWRLRVPTQPIQITEPSLPRDILRDRYVTDAVPELVQLFCDTFWLAVCRWDGSSNTTSPYPQLDRSAAGWMAEGLDLLKRAAHEVAQGKLALCFSSIYEAAGTLAPVTFSNAWERNFACYISFKRGLAHIAVDLHLLGSEGAIERRVPAAQLEAVRGSLHWSDEAWISDRVADRLALLSPEAAIALLQDQVTELAGRVTEFHKRSERWCQLASFAKLHGVGDAHALIRRSADCLLGYGYRKDLSAVDALDAIAQVYRYDPSHSRRWITKITPVVNAITEFTDGDETDHVRSDLIETVASATPDLLPAFYRHHIREDEWRYADKCLRELLKLVPLDTPQAAALAATLLDPSSLALLEERAVTDDASRQLYERQLSYLGGPIAAQQERHWSTDEPPRKGRRIRVGRFAPKRLDALLEAFAGSETSFDTRRTLLREWLDHWSAKGNAIAALKAIEACLESHESGNAVEDVLDDAFRVSLAAEGKEAAYRWLVRAHIYRRGWASFWVNEKEVTARLERAATLYRDRWLQFIKESAIQPPYWRQHGYGLVIGQKYLVRFLLLVGQLDIAVAVTEALVSSLVTEVRDQPIGEAPWLA